ncbi:MAG: hypothetical protein Q9219_005104 [cf. Caloplaca sp. 3 TL-2023]
MSTSAIGWQVDLPGLLSLVLNMGTAGLKKIAQAGVDIHTLLCMGEIAEICQASLECRREINECRQKQRKQSLWIYKIVEIGTASNFIADELLKKRAGENIVALMSTILPILSEDDCDSVILGLFDALKINSDKTPGLGQLTAFRDAILPLAQKLPFKDKTYNYHILIDQLESQDPRPLNTSIPTVQLIAQVVMMLQKVILDGETRCMLVYRGWRGAAWVIAYARHVLGLPVCILRTAQDCVPINGHYQSSKVLVYVSEEQSNCELLVNGELGDFVTPTDSIPNTRWAVDLDNVNLRDALLPNKPLLEEPISIITRSLALYFTALLAYHFEEYNGPHDHNTNRKLRDSTKLSPYTLHCLPKTNVRVLKILDMMGFGIRTDVEPDAKTWQDFLSLEPGVRANDPRKLEPGPRWTDSSLLYQERHQNAAEPYLSFTVEGGLLLERVFAIADVASCLAYSNWGDDVRLLSTAAIEKGLPELYSSYIWEKGNHTRTRPRVYLRAHLICSLHDLQDAVKYCIIGESMEYDLEMIAFELQGIIFALATATNTSINYDAKLIDIHVGYITMFDQRRRHIKADNNSIYKGRKESDRENFAKSHQISNFYPFNTSSELSIQFTAKLSRTSIYIACNMVVDNNVVRLECPSFNSRWALFVTRKCAHSYYSPASGVSHDDIPIQNLFFGSGFPKRGKSMDRYIFIRAVDQNASGQWASVHDRYADVHILQRNMCTQCVLDEIVRCILDGETEMSRIMITPGRQPGEAIDEHVTNEGTNSLPLNSTSE